MVILATTNEKRLKRYKNLFHKHESAFLTKTYLPPVYRMYNFVVIIGAWKQMSYKFPDGKEYVCLQYVTGDLMEPSVSVRRPSSCWARFRMVRKKTPFGTGIKNIEHLVTKDMFVWLSV